MLYESANVQVRLAGGLATLAFDFAGPGINRLSSARLLELDTAIRVALNNPHVEILAIESAHPAGFCDGYDLTEYEFSSDFARFGQSILNRLAAAPCITVAKLHGPVFDAGLDLACACDYRFAVAMPKTALGFPGLQSGIMTAWGGLTRLTRIAGASNAAELIAGEATLNARQAREIGLIDRVACGRRAKIEWTLFLQSLKRKPKRLSTWFDGWAARRVASAYRDWQANARHPAARLAMQIIPEAAVSLDAGLRCERRFLETLRDDDRACAEFEIERDLQNETLPSIVPKSLAAIGDECDRIDDLTESLLSNVVVFSSAEIRAGISERLNAFKANGRITPLEAENALAKSCDLARAESAAIVLMAGVDAASLEIAEEIAEPAAAILVPLADVECLSAMSSRPQNLVGYRVRNAVVELTRKELTIPRAIDTAVAWFASLQRIPIALMTGQGSLIDTLQAALWDEAVRLVAEGVSIELIDQAAQALGAETGPLETLDRLGLEAVQEQVPRVKPLLAAGIAGRPAADGFYVLHDDEPAGPNAVAQLVLLEAAAKKRPQRLSAASPRVQFSLCQRRLAGRVLASASRFQQADPYLSSAGIRTAIARGLNLFPEKVRFTDDDAMHAELRELQMQHGRRFKCRTGFRAAA